MFTTAPAAVDVAATFPRLVPFPDHSLAKARVRRAFARQRALVGPMPPTGMPGAALISR
ncbi:hypothetical protein ACQP2P_34125 [Dactylosporangium sp. CA-139114]|uniref:hypothetical protein n=1 Tax=Dactylosporangium sp. CA-139114 TaxID=3239931 RepID=UPI003D9917D7